MENDRNSVWLERLNHLYSVSPVEEEFVVHLLAKKDWLSGVDWSDLVEMEQLDSPCSRSFDCMN